MMQVINNSDKSIPYMIHFDCESGLSVTSGEEQESDTQKEEIGGDYSYGDFENMSSIDTDSVDISIDTLDRIVFEGSYRLSSDEERQNDTNDEQSLDVSKNRGKHFRSDLICIMFSLFCSVIIVFPIVCIICDLITKFSIN